MTTFYIYDTPSFRDYLDNSRFSRKITFIQNHHTWDPDYSSLRQNKDEMHWLDAMRNYHVQVRGWSDIGQNLTTFPSGNIGLCRPIDTTPAGILGANAGAICIENLGNFDAGKDSMTDEQKKTIVFLNAILCLKFNLTPVRSQIVYHHWFDRTGKPFPDDKINNGQVGVNEQKTCPGTAFFGTNTITSAEANFFPLIVKAIADLTSKPSRPSPVKKVNADGLNVRSGPGIQYPANPTDELHLNDPVTIYATSGGWSKISRTEDKWVYSAYLS